MPFEDRGERNTPDLGWPELPDREPGSSRLTDLLALGPSEVVAAVGAGGKSSFLERLAQDYEAEDARVIITTTTKVWAPLGSGGRPLVTAASLDELLAALRREPRRSPLVGTQLVGGKLRGVPPGWIPALRDVPWVGAVLVEADGAVGLPLKAPSSYEPVLPGGTSLVVSVAGLEAHGVALQEGHVHRPEQLAQLLDLPLGSVLSLADVLRAAIRGYLPHRPPGARFLALLNKSDLKPADHALARVAARGDAEVWAGSVWTGAFDEIKGRDLRPAAVVLAAGLGQRMGGDKVLASLGGRSVLGRVVGAVVAHTGIGRVVVVAGEEHARIGELLRAEVPAGGYAVVRNDTPSLGLSSSLRLGVLALEPPTDLLVLLGDQPFVSADTLCRLLQAYLDRPRAAAIGLSPPEPVEQPAGAGAVRPPLVLHRSLLPQVLELHGDQGARTLLGRYADSLVAVPAEDLELLDLDTPEDLERARAAIERERRRD